LPSARSRSAAVRCLCRFYESLRPEIGVPHGRQLEKLLCQSDPLRVISDLLIERRNRHLEHIRVENHLFACIIEMQAGEKIAGEPQIGDSVRWNISPGMYGNGDQATQIIVLKPQEAGLDTNLLITTDRRAYYLRLVSKPQEYVARVAFRYPEEENSHKWQQHLVEQRAQEREAKRDSQMLPAMITAEKLNFAYSVTGGNEHIRSERVYDDGSKTYIQMKPEIQNREAPVLLVIGADGKGETTNYRVRAQTYIVDRLFDRARLVLGSGKKSQKVEISRDREPQG